MPGELTFCFGCHLTLITEKLFFNSKKLGDLVESYLLETLKIHFRHTIYHSIYNNDDLLVFKGKKMVQYIRDWLGGFKNIVNNSAGNQQLQFTAKIWNFCDQWITPPVH